MKLEDQLKKRSEGKCELCSKEAKLTIYEVPPQTQTNEDNCIMLCEFCLTQVEKKAELDGKHWQCLTTSMWSDVAGV